MSRVVAVVQARMGSTRLPGKVMLPLLDEPILRWVMRRVTQARLVDDAVVATTLSADDEPIVRLARDEGWAIERGSELDLLDRYVQAARAQRADIVVRITSDCPLIDPALIDDAVAAFSTGDVDYVSNTLEPRTYPRGLDVEVVARDALERAWREDDNPDWREHATPYIYRHPERFRLLRVAGAQDRSAHRWSVDTPDDYELVRRICEAIGRTDFGWREALAVAEADPSWGTANRNIRQKTVPP